MAGVHHDPVTQFHVVCHDFHLCSGGSCDYVMCVCVIVFGVLQCGEKVNSRTIEMMRKVCLLTKDYLSISV